MDFGIEFHPITAKAARDALGVTSLLEQGKYLPLYLLGYRGDGAYHPLRETYGSLAEAQRYFPRAASLDEQIDHHAIQRLIDLGAVGSIDLPAGQFYLHGPLEVDGARHLTMTGAGIKATTGVLLTGGTGSTRA